MKKILQKIRDAFKQIDSWKRVLVILVIPIITGVLANYLFSYLTDAGDDLAEIEYRNIKVPAASDGYDLLIKDAIENMNRGNFNEALKEIEGCQVFLKQGIEDEGVHSLLHGLKGECLLELGSLESAEKELKEAVNGINREYFKKILARLYFRLYQETKNEEYLELQRKYYEEASEPLGEFINLDVIDNSMPFLPEVSFQDYFSSKKSMGKTYVFLIGVNKYKDKNIQGLNYSLKDVELLKGTIRDRYKEEHVVIRTFLNENAQKDIIMENLRETVCVMNRQDRLVFYFSGHGYSLSEKGKLKTSYYVNNSFSADQYIMPYDYNSSLTLTSAIAIKELKDIISCSKLEVPPLMIIDACRTFQDNTSSDVNSMLSIRESKNSREIIKPNVNRIINLYKKGEILGTNVSLIVINSTTVNGKSVGLKKYNNGLFTYLLNESLRSNESDFDKNGVTTFLESLDFVEIKINEMKESVSKISQRSTIDLYID